MLYFGYGSNMNHDQMSRRCPSAKYVGSMFLRGWELAFNTHATIIPRRGKKVPGALWLITVDDLISLDSYEGFPTYYTRRRWKQDNNHFFFYEMAPSNKRYVPSDHYVQSIAQGYKDCGLDTKYLYERVNNDSRILMVS
jgi:hypothetical protein